MRIAYLRRTDRQTDRGTSALVELRFAAKNQQMKTTNNIHISNNAGFLTNPSPIRCQLNANLRTIYYLNLFALFAVDIPP